MKPSNATVSMKVTSEVAITTELFSSNEQIVALLILYSYPH